MIWHFIPVHEPLFLELKEKLFRYAEHQLVSRLEDKMMENDTVN